jgi:hypothetical protein
VPAPHGSAGRLPEAVGEEDPELGEWEFAEGGERWRWCGLAVLDFAGPTVTVRYIAGKAGEHARDVLPAD